MEIYDENMILLEVTQINFTKKKSYFLMKLVFIKKNWSKKIVELHYDKGLWTMWLSTKSTIQTIAAERNGVKLNLNGED
jgi:hypothetical protein